MFDWGDSPLVPPELPTRMNSGVPFELSCWAMTWSSELPTGFALNLVSCEKLKGSLLFGVTGCSVKYEPHGLRCGSFPCPRPPPLLLLCVHSFMARMPRGMSSLDAYGASGAMLLVKSVAASAPCDFLGKNFVVTHP